jgi:formylglycine-generating enzyme
MKNVKIILTFCLILGLTVCTFAQRTVKMRTSDRTEDGGKWAVIVGVNDYEDKQINDLQFAVADATAIYKLLTDSKLEGFEPAKVKLLTDTSETKPNRENILLALKSIERNADEKDTIFIFFSGHGIEERGMSYFLPSDTNINLVSDTAISMDRFMRPLEDTKAKTQILFFDACHSGVRLDNKSVDGSMSGDAFDFIFREAQGRVILSSCQNEEISWEYPEKGKGVFTYFLLDALKGKADVDKNSIVSVSEASNYVTEKVKEWSFANNRQQNPRLLYNVTGDITLTVLPVDITKPQIFIEDPEPLRISTQAVFYRDSLPDKLIGVVADNIGVAIIRINDRKIPFMPLPDEQRRRWETKLDQLLDKERQSPEQVVRFEFPFNLAEGENRIWISALDDAGNSFDLTCTLNVQQQPNLISTMATLVVSSRPSGAFVYVDERAYGKTPLTTEIDLGIQKQREVEVGLKLNGYKNRVASLTLKRGKKTFWGEDVPLEPLPAVKKATLVVSSRPSGATVYVDGSPYGKTPLKTEVDLGVQGQQEVEVGLKLDGYKTKLAALTLKHRQTTYWEDQQLEELPTGPDEISPIATVTISSEPKGASVYIDEKDYGTTPLTAEVDMGVFPEKQVSVKLVLSGYKPYETNMTLIRSKKASLANIKLEMVNLDEDMVLIPAGIFWMGSKGGRKQEYAHEVYLDAFYIDKYEVTNAQYRAFVQVTGHLEPQGILLSEQGIDMNFRPWEHPEWNAPNQPVACVNWEDASAYAQWVGKSLPTEAQWEKAARGGLDRKEYPWGDPFKVGLVAKDRLHSVGSYSANDYGVYDMMGNVWEWCLDWYDTDYYKDSPRRNPVNQTPPKYMRFRVIRGGSWRDNAPSFFRCAVRGRLDPTTKDTATGFRCVKPAK